MISLQYIPLSVRVRSWNLSLFSKEELESFLHIDAPAVMAQVAQKERNYTLDTSSSKVFVDSTLNAVVEYMKVARKASSGATRGFIKELFHEFEIDNLRNVVRMLVSGNFYNVFYHHEFTPKITVAKMAEIRTFNEFYQLIEDTPYHIFRPILEQVAHEKNALYWEVALENYYVGRIVKSSQQMDAASRKAIKKLLLMPIQWNRLVSLYRYRFHYNVEPMDAIYYVPNLTNIISYDEWTKLAFATNNVEFYHYLIQLGYISPETQNNASAIRIEFNRSLERISRHFLRGDLTSIASFLAFIQIKKIQFQKIATILEAKTLSVSHTDVMNFL